MSLWVDKYRPQRLDRLDFHTQLNQMLEQLSVSNDLPHLLFYGPSGAGKKTRILALLRQLYGPGVEKMVLGTRHFQTPGGTKLELHTVSSHYHTELTPSDVGLQDRLVVQEVIKEIAQTQQVDATSSRRFKIVVINEADRLSKDAQHGLRRTMEKYMGNLRLILCCNSTSKIIAPIRSRCLLLRIAAPTHEEIADVLNKVATKENVQTTPAYLEHLAVQSERNLRKALLMLESAAVQSPNQILQDTHAIPLADWEQFLQQVSQLILSEQSPTRLLEVRTKLYEVLAHCLPAELVLKTLAFELMKRVDASMKLEVIRQAAFFDHRLRMGNKPIYHLEAFVAKFMSLYKRFLLDFSL